MISWCVPDAVQHVAPLGAEWCTADPGSPRNGTAPARACAIPGLQRTTALGFAFATCCAAPGTHEIGTRMKFGLFGGAKSSGEGSADSQSYGKFIEYVLTAEELGYESLFVVEHHFTGVS